MRGAGCTGGRTENVYFSVALYTQTGSVKIKNVIRIFFHCTVSPLMRRTQTCMIFCRFYCVQTGMMRACVRMVHSFTDYDEENTYYYTNPCARRMTIILHSEQILLYLQ